MRLSQASDYALRILMYVAQSKNQTTVDQLIMRLHISKSLATKLAAKLAKDGYLRTLRGRGGGIALAKPPKAIRIGEVVRTIEPDLGVVACLQPNPSFCPFLPACVLKGAMADAADAFIETLNHHTLESILTGTQPARIPPE